MKKRLRRERLRLLLRDGIVLEALGKRRDGQAGSLETGGASRRLGICFLGTPWLAVQERTGGIPKTLLELSRILSHEHEIHILCPTPRPTEHVETEPEIQFHYAPVVEVRHYPIRDQLDLSMYGLGLALRLAFAVVVMATVYAGLRHRLKLDVTYLSNKYVAAPLLLLRGRRRSGVFIYSERNIWPWLHPAPSKGWARLRYKANVFLGRVVCQRSDAVHVLSESLRDAMVSQGIDGRIIASIPNGIDVHTQGVDPPPLSPPIRVGFVGRLVEVKGVRILADAIRKLNAVRPEVQFDIFGDGPLRSLLTEAKLQNCRIWGDRPREEVLETLRSIHIALFLSPIENIPSNALMEALALGKAVIATNVGDTPRFLNDGHNCILCDPDAASVARTITDLLDDHEQYERVTSGAQSFATANSWDVIARRHVDFYSSVIHPAGV